MLSFIHKFGQIDQIIEFHTSTWKCIKHFYTCFSGFGTQFEIRKYLN